MFSGSSPRARGDTPRTPDAAQFFGGTSSLWGEMQLRATSLNEVSPHLGRVGSPSPAGSGAAGTGSAGLAAPLAPAPARWGRVSASGARAAPVLETPSPRRTSTEADQPEVTPPKTELGNAGLPRLLRASTGPRAGSPGQRLISTPLPTWAAADAKELAEPGTAEADISRTTASASPNRRLRTKTPPGSPARAAAEPRAATPPPHQLVSGPASSLGNLLERTCATHALGAMPPMKRPRTARWMEEQRGTVLMEIPIEALQEPESADPDTHPRRFPKRIRMPPLEFWRNERVVYERTPGTKTPSIKGVVLNFAPRMQSMGERQVRAQALLEATPVLLEGQKVEFVSVQSDTLESKLVILPPFSGRANPPTYMLPAFSRGQIYVIEGSARLAFEGERDKAILHTGDHVLLSGADQEILLASAGIGGANAGAKLKVFLVNGEGMAKDNHRIPLESARSVNTR